LSVCAFELGNVVTICLLNTGELFTVFLLERVDDLLVVGRQIRHQPVPAVFLSLELLRVGLELALLPVLKQRDLGSVLGLETRKRLPVVSGLHLEGVLVFFVFGFLDVGQVA